MKSATFARAALAAALLPLAAGAQQRLLQPEDLPGRRAAARQLEAVLDDERDLWTTIALAATAGTELADGSQAATALDAALTRAHATADAERSLSRLRLDLGDLVDVLDFRVVQEAEMPPGFPEPKVIGELELRRYPTYRMARTSMGPGGSTGAFWPLFQHIKKNDIAMTAPVQMDYGEQRRRPATMAFLYGSRDIEPRRVDDEITVVDVPAITVLSIGSNGYERDSRVEQLEQRLRAFVAANDEWEAAGPIRTMGYNDPRVGEERRYWEVQLPVQRAAVIR